MRTSGQGGNVKLRVFLTRCDPIVMLAMLIHLLNAKIQPDMISLDPEFVGSLAPEPKLTTAVNDKHDIPFARLPRLERLRVSGQADETEETDAEEDVEDVNGDAKLSKAEKEKKKMRGKNKSLKRCTTQ